MGKGKVTLTLFLILFLNISFVSAKRWYLLHTNTYSIEFPKKPAKQIDMVTSKYGNLQMTIFTYNASQSSNDDNLMYRISSVVYPDSINSDKKEKLTTFFKSTADRAIKNVRGRLLSEKSIEIFGYPGNEIRIDYEDGIAIIRMVNLLVHNKLITLQTIAQSSKESNASGLRFMESFKLK